MFQCINLKGSIPKSTLNSCSKNPGNIINVPGVGLKCSDKTSYPVFHEPKTGARCTKLKMKPDLKGVWAGHEQFHIKPKPGMLIIFPGFLEHEFSVDFGIEPFRFIHWNIQAVPKEMAKDV